MAKGGAGFGVMIFARRIFFWKLVSAAAATVALTQNASAQFTPKLSLQGEEKRKLTPEEEEQRRKLDDAYKATVNSKIPDQKAVNDPWATVRPTPSASAAPVKKKQQ
jgi:hypothetical protein